MNANILLAYNVAFKLLSESEIDMKELGQYIQKEFGKPIAKRVYVKQSSALQRFKASCPETTRILMNNAKKAKKL